MNSSSTKRSSMKAAGQSPNETPTKKRGCLKGCVTIVAIVVVAPMIFIWLVSPGITYIGFRPVGEPYKRTEFEFRFGHATRYVHDHGNHMQWVYGQLPDSISIENGVRTIVYNEPKEILKSWGDSMDAQNDSLKHKGWMGIWSNGTHFDVDSNGVIQERR